MECVFLNSQDAYLHLAEQVLSSVRRPMSSKDILRSAFIMGLVPEHLHGRTQHKTLTARLSVDILKFKQKSRFFRPWPGGFFLNKFLKDDSLPLEYRVPIIARRRARELKKEYAAYLTYDDILYFSKNHFIANNNFRRIVYDSRIGYSLRGDFGDGQIPIWTFGVVCRGEYILTYRKGKYKDGRESFAGFRSIGFTSPLTHDDYTLFDRRDHGVTSNAITTIAMDLDLEYSPVLAEFETKSKFLGCAICDLDGQKSAIAVVRVIAPKEFSAFSKRLAINDLSWVHATNLRQRLPDLDPWSVTVINGILGRF
jgi:hypothetical protein